MTGRKITINFIIATIAIVAIFDIWIFMNYGGDSTISRVALGWTSSRPVLAITMFGIGFLCGHLFWPQRIHGK